MFLVKNAENRKMFLVKNAENRKMLTFVSGFFSCIFYLIFMRMSCRTTMLAMDVRHEGA